MSATAEPAGKSVVIRRDLFFFPVWRGCIVSRDRTQQCKWDRMPTRQMDLRVRARAI